MSTAGTYAGLYELEFERSLTALERQIHDLESHVGEQGVDIAHAFFTRKGGRPVTTVNSCGC